MFTTSPPNPAIRIAAKVAVVAVAIAGVVLAQPSGASTSATPSPAAASAGVVGPEYNNCPGSPCIILAEIDTAGPTVKFRGETKYVTKGSQWYLVVQRNGVEVASYASDYLSTNRLNADLGALPAGGSYQLTVVVGTPSGDQRLIKSFTTGPAVTATPTATNVKLGFTMPVGVSATAQIRKANGTIVATIASTGVAKTHTLTSSATLNPTTSYSYQVNATDAQGRFYIKVGSFQTRNVRLEVKLTGLQITNDSDYFGAGELRAQMHVGGTKRWIWSAEKSVETASSTKYFPINVTAALPSAVRSVPINVIVSDDDCEGIGSLCNSGIGDLSTGSGTLSDQQWATATYTATLPNTTTTTTWTNFISSAKNPVGFIVTGSYRWVMV